MLIFERKIPESLCVKGDTFCKVKQHYTREISRALLIVLNKSSETTAGGRKDSCSFAARRNGES